MYNTVFVGGTFDGLHKGHEMLLNTAFASGQKVTIGLTSDDFVQKYKLNPDSIRTFSDRKASLAHWLDSHNLTKRADIIPIHDPYEPSITYHYDAMIVTAHNRTRGEHINDIRKKRELPALVLIEAPLVNASDGKPISSTRVRVGEIDEKGRLIMPELLRDVLQKPLGHILAGPEIARSIKTHAAGVTVAVGDVTTKTLLDHAVQPTLAIIDLRVARQPYHLLQPYIDSQLPHCVSVNSGPGYISQSAMKVLEGWATQIKSKSTRPTRVIVVAGEEDLLTLPAIIHGPNGAVVYYGQPNKGLVELLLTDQMKKEAKKLLEKFT